MKNNLNRAGFPLSVFLILFIILFMLSAAISTGYFYYSVKNDISDIIDNTRTYALSITETLANVAELCYYNKNYSRLKKLLKENINKRNIDEAFFVLKSGKIIAHSDPRMIKEFGGNIAADEFTYNLDQIFLPLKSKSKKVQFLDYNIFDKKVPFSKDKKKVFKRYIYDKIDIVGWLTTRGIFIRGKGVGCICLFINKGKIYSSINNHLETSINVFFLLIIGVFAVSMMISIIVYTRYKNLGSLEAKEEYAIPEEIKFEVESIKEGVRLEGAVTEPSSSKLQNWELTIPVIELQDNGNSNGVKKIIKDAIPISDN